MVPRRVPWGRRLLPNPQRLSPDAPFLLLGALAASVVDALWRVWEGGWQLGSHWDSELRHSSNSSPTTALV